MPKFIIALLTALLTTAGIGQISAITLHMPYIVAAPRACECVAARVCCAEKERSGR